MILLKFRRSRNQGYGKGRLYSIYYNEHFIGHYRSSNKEYGNSYIIYHTIENNTLYGNRYYGEEKGNKIVPVKYNLPKNSILPIERQTVQIKYC